MTDEERRIIQTFIERIAGVAQAAPSRSPWGASVPQVGQAPNLPPVDPEADRFIADLFARLPEARYRLTQSAFVQEAALVEANNRIQRLEWEVENARRQGEGAQQPRGMFGGMFGGGRPQQAPMPPPPQPQYPPGYNPQALQQGRGGMGFLGTALAGAAGVAGGLVLGNMLMNSLGGHGGAAQAAAATPGQGAFGQEAVPAEPSSPWTSPTPDAAPVADQGGWDAGSGGGQADNWGSGSQDDASADFGGGGGGNDDY
ncbi:DUF2076 family protein [Plastoroseomonas arctica]|uniref:DUF2076 domain-containing protein n=1 Tax=Plastoroseomonas arctica TaxID=1509237 RepID=A0AAF1KIT5_9PROT|nr:DUF2076 family protein [Plastoroseomonas arctica]MBR0654884.1 DUF2076 domain-containing protein [Plastoroseomonas arctica]